jgi:hypothetical protein
MREHDSPRLSLFERGPFESKKHKDDYCPPIYFLNSRLSVHVYLAEFRDRFMYKRADSAGAAAPKLALTLAYTRRVVAVPRNQIEIICSIEFGVVYLTCRPT